MKYMTALDEIVSRLSVHDIVRYLEEFFELSKNSSYLSDRACLNLLMCPFICKDLFEFNGIQLLGISINDKCLRNNIFNGEDIDRSDLDKSIEIIKNNIIYVDFLHSNFTTKYYINERIIFAFIGQVYGFFITVISTNKELYVYKYKDINECKEPIEFFHILMLFKIIKYYHSLKEVKTLPRYIENKNSSKITRKLELRNKSLFKIHVLPEPAQIHSLVTDESKSISEGNGIKLDHRVEVKGHYRWQACGKNWEERKLIFIEKFIRGKDLPEKPVLEILRKVVH